MKQINVFCLALCSCVFLSGCSLGDIVDRYLPQEDSAVTEAPSDTDRTYMDEIAGTLVTFDGSSLTMTHEDSTYTFDVSKSSLETMQGMISGDQISVIYEGQLTSDATDNVKALKVVDAIHKKEVLKDQTLQGTVQSISSNVLSLKSDDGKTVVFTITGVPQSYHGGIKAGANIVVHYLGDLLPADTENTLNGSHVKVLSISDGDPFSVPKAYSDSSAGKFRGYISVLENQTLRVRPSGSSSMLSIDLSSIPVYFDGGSAPRSGLTVYYSGSFNKENLEGISVISIKGDDFSTIQTRKITSTVSGVIIGSTANTISLQTNDGGFVTVTTDEATNNSTGGLEIGSSVRVTFDPNASRNSNLYHGLSISDI